MTTRPKCIGCNRPSAHAHPLVFKVFAFAVARLKGNVLQTFAPAFRGMILMFVFPQDVLMKTQLLRRFWTLQRAKQLASLS